MTGTLSARAHNALANALGSSAPEIESLLEQASASEQAVLSGVTPGTATANKALVIGASKEIATITSATITTLTGSVRVFNGATGVNEIQIPTNLADALSIESSAGDILVIDTTTGAVAVTLTTSAAAGLTLASHLTMGDAKNIILNTTTGTKIGTAVGQKLGFYNATPVVQPASANQATIGAPTYAAPDAGTVDGTYGAEEQAVIESLRTQLIALAADVATHRTLLNQVRADLVTLGILKGAA